MKIMYSVSVYHGMIGVERVLILRIVEQNTVIPFLILCENLRELILFHVTVPQFHLTIVLHASP